MRTRDDTPADTVIRLFGGARVVAGLTGISETQVYRWRHPRSRGGQDGQVPGRHHLRLMAEASRRGIDLRPEHLQPDITTAA